MDKSTLHIEKGDYTALIQDTNKQTDIRLTVKKKEYVLISIIFQNGEIVRERSFEHNGVKVPQEAIRILKRSATLLKNMFPEFNDLRMSDIDKHVS